MDWSKARRTLESRFAAPAQGRVGVHVTRYRRAHDQEGEIWVTVDGVKVYGSSYYQFVKGRNEIAPPAPDWRPTDKHREAEDELRTLGVADHTELIAAALESLNQSVDEMMLSPHPLIRAFAVLDRRMGRRRLAKLDVADEHELVRLAAALREASLKTPV